jgi:hypothetical protein
MFSEDSNVGFRKYLHQQLKFFRCLPEDKHLLVGELFFPRKKRAQLASELGIANMTLHDRKHRILKKFKKLLEN